MTAPRFPDHFPSLREVDGLSDTAFRLHMTAFFWCAANHTDGLVPKEDLDLVSARVRAPERFAAECVRRGTWHEARHDCGSADCPAPVDVKGWVLHNYLKENRSKAELEAEQREREAEIAGKSAGGSLGNHRRWHANRGITEPGCEFCPAPPSDKRSDKRSPSDQVNSRSSVDRSDIRSVTDRSTESGPNPNKTLTLTLTQSPLVNLVSQSADRNARPREGDPADDESTQQVIDAIYLVTGQFVTAEHARQVAAEILGKAKRPVRDQLKFVLAAITKEAETGSPYARFLPPSEPLFPAQTPPCGKCDGNRMRERPDGKLARCPDCHPLRDEAVRTA